jgi:peptide/nickel transport system substrate-binding protein
MWAGSADLNFDAAPSKQKAVSGLQPGKSWTFVRNPSWSQDSLRPAYIDGMNWAISPGADPTVLNKKVTDGELDTVFENSVPPTILRQYQTTSNLRPMLHVNPSAGNYYITLNTAVAPLDDLHLRKAIEYAIDKAAIQRIRGGPIAWPIGNHFVPDSLLTTSDGTEVLKDYNPYATPGDKGDDTSAGLDLAKKEMAQSKYDPGHTGMCTDPACQNVLALGGNTGTDPAYNSQVASNLAKIGIKLDLKQLNSSAIYAKILDPANKVPIALTPGWLQDYPDAYTFFFLIAYGPNILAQGNSNYSMVGATAAQLTKYGYTIKTAPSIDSQIEACFSTTGDDRVNCWAGVDKAFMDIAALVPTDFSNTVNIVSSRVVNYTFSAFDSQTAYEQIAINGGASSP